MRRAAASCALAIAATAAHAQWLPQKGVEIVAMSGPGGANDVIARAIQRHLQQLRLVGVPITVSNRPGAGGVIAWNYLNQHAGEGTLLSVSPINLLTEHIAGASPITWTDVTPIALLFSEYVAFSVRPDSALKDGGDLVRRLKGDPGSVTFAVAAALGGANHIATALAMKAAGVDIRRLKFVVFSSGAQSLAAVMGGHVDVAVNPVSGAAPQMQAGRVRVVAVSSPQRLPGTVSPVPTWKEQGVDAVFSSFRGVIGPKGMTPEQVAYWEGVLAKMARSEEWKREMERNYWESSFAGAAEAARFLAREYERLRAVLGELGLARR
ncbi:MAG TPA: tripartite tricarboxylate transporter substrate binding protein [Burkholderiales bacterium]|nr:tripartite tricarboxylate transporter substrate binding protein [Burkholderiales bacterium]